MSDSLCANSKNGFYCNPQIKPYSVELVSGPGLTPPSGQVGVYLNTTNGGSVIRFDLAMGNMTSISSIQHGLPVLSCGSEIARNAGRDGQSNPLQSCASFTVTNLTSSAPHYVRIACTIAAGYGKYHRFYATACMNLGPTVQCFTAVSNVDTNDTFSYKQPKLFPCSLRLGSAAAYHYNKSCSVIDLSLPNTQAQVLQFAGSDFTNDATVLTITYVSSC